MGLTFEWDVKKATANQSKHGVSFEEATTVLNLSGRVVDTSKARLAERPQTVT